MQTVMKMKVDQFCPDVISSCESCHPVCVLAVNLYDKIIVQGLLCSTDSNDWMDGLKFPYMEHVH